MSIAKIVFSNGTESKLISHLYIPEWMTEYFEMDCVIHSDHGSLAVPRASHCELCFREFSEATHPAQTLCSNRKINREFGRVAKICVDCNWYMEQAKGNSNIPKSIKKSLDAGHKPLKFVNLIL